MGLVKEGDDYVILTDIQGAEDHLGDMDFKVAGTQRGHHRAADGHQDHRRQPRDHAAGLSLRRSGLASRSSAKMLEAIAEPREELAEHAPRISTVQINPEFIGMVIGKGGETIRSLEAEYEVQIDIEEDGTILVYATEGTKGDAAIEAITASPRSPRSATRTRARSSRRPTSARSSS
jgi:polyribonucleotide nucleotidyltransferase